MFNATSRQFSILGFLVAILVALLVSGCDTRNAYEKAADGAVVLRKGPFCVYPEKAQELWTYFGNLEEKALEDNAEVPYEILEDFRGNTCLTHKVSLNGDVYVPRHALLGEVATKELDDSETPSSNP